MDAGGDHDFIIANDVDQAVGKPPQYRAARVVKHDGIQRGMSLHDRNGCIERA